MSKLIQKTMKLELNNEGFTLVEILVVLFVLSVGVLPLVAIQNSARREVTKADNYTQMMFVAQEQLERIKGLGFGVAASDSGTIGNVDWVCRVTNQNFGLDRLVVTATCQASGGDVALTIADMVSVR